MRNYSMAVCAPNDAFGDLFLRLSNAFRKAHVKEFLVPNMVKVKGAWIAEPAIGASSRSLVVAEPLPDRGGSGVGFLVNRFPVAVHSESGLAPRFIFGWIVSIRALAFVRVGYLFGVANPPSLSSFPPRGLLGFGIFLHQTILHPCKPDIFEATYEAVDAPGDADEHVCAWSMDQVAKGWWK